MERPSSGGTTATDGLGTSGAESQEDPVPYPRFKDVNDKYAKVRWAEDFGDSDPETVRAQVALAKWANDDPKGFYEYYSSQLRAHGLLPQPTAEPARSAERQAEGPPGPDYRDPTTGLTVYSAERAQALVQYHVEQLEKKLEQRLGPTEKFFGNARVQMQARNEAMQILRDAQSWPYFEQNKADIFKEFAKGKMTLETAYRRVVVPSLESKARQDVIASTEAKTGATTISPSSAQGGGREDLTKLPFKTLLQREFRKRGLGK